MFNKKPRLNSRRKRRNRIYITIIKWTQLQIPAVASPRWGDDYVDLGLCHFCDGECLT